MDSLTFSPEPWVLHYTTLYDDDPKITSAVSIAIDQREASPGIADAATRFSKYFHAQVNSHAYTQIDQESKRTSKANLRVNDIPGYGSFSLISGESARPPKRSAFTEDQKRETNEVRKVGACLRCSAMKRKCSGGNPCRRCLSASQTKLAPRILRQIECVRYSFKDMNIFGQVDLSIDEARLRLIMEDLLKDEQILASELPFQLHTVSASQYIAQQLTHGTNHWTFRVPAFLRSHAFAQILRPSLGPQPAELLRILAYVSTRVYRSHEAIHRGYSQEELYFLRDYVGNLMLAKLHTALQPACIESSTSKRQNLSALFLACFAISLIARYKYLDAILGVRPVNASFKNRMEAFTCLINYHLHRIGTKTAIIDISSGRRILEMHNFSWNKPVAVSWQQDSSMTMAFGPNGENAARHISTPHLQNIHTTQDLSLQLPDCLACRFWTAINNNGVCQDCQSSNPLPSTISVLDASTSFSSLKHFTLWQTPQSTPVFDGFPSDCRNNLLDEEDSIQSHIYAQPKSSIDLPNWATCASYWTPLFLKKPFHIHHRNTQRDWTYETTAWNNKHFCLSCAGNSS